ncbi:hypothetical protein KP509_25G037300 [Ceratopteris richardii]|nr:hypothetical protein KP509_25G037300 [Ceratopteris richardii]
MPSTEVTGTGTDAATAFVRLLNPCSYRGAIASIVSSPSLMCAYVYPF